MSFVCLASSPTDSSSTHSFIVELGQYGNTTQHNFSIKPDPNTFFATPVIDTESPQDKTTETINTDSYSGSDSGSDSGSGSDSPPDDKPYRPGHLWQSLTTVVESVSWRLLYASNEVIGYKLLLTLQEGSYQPKPFSWMPVVATVVVGWLSRSYWDPEAPMFNQLDEQATNQKHELRIITLMYKSGGGHSSPTSTSDSNPSLNMRSSFTGLMHYSFIHHQGRNDGDGPGWPTPIVHTRDESCLLEPCRKNKRCIYAPARIYQHSDFHFCQTCMTKLVKFNPRLLISTAQCDSTHDGAIVCNLNNQPQTGGQESASNSVGLPAEVQTSASKADSTTSNLETSQGGECGINGCTQRFAVPSRKKSHQAEVHGVGGEVCGINGCMECFAWPSSKKSHQAEVHGVGGAVCGINGCMECFAWPSGKKSHQAEVHGVGGEVCGINGCMECFAWPSSKKSHQAEVHGVGGEECGINGCTKHFAKLSRKESHQAAVHRVGGEECGINGCTKRFTITSQMESHQAQIHGVGGEACGINGCPRRYTKSAQKKSHQAEVHGVGGTECGIDGCPRRFTKPASKKSHQARMHYVGGEECGINGCTERFTMPCNKKSHQLRKHGVGGDLPSNKRKRKHTEEDND